MDSIPKSIITTKRGLNYNVYHFEPQDCKPTLVFLHGFPNSAFDWRYQVKFFKKLGYGLIVPDMLGYGGTDKPLDTNLYAASLIAQDVVDLIDAIGLTKGSNRAVIPIGHDWGSKIVSRLVNLHQERFTAFGYLAVGYNPPDPDRTYEQILKASVAFSGRELFGYWSFFSKPESVTLVKAHYDAFWDGLFAFEPETMKKIAATGGFEEYLPKDLEVPLPSWLPEEDAKVTKQNFLDTGLEAPFNWYKVVTSTIDVEDAKSIPKENYKVTKPIFYGAARNDMVALADLFYASMKPYVAPELLTAHNYSASHWVQWEKRDEVNQDINNWIGTLGLAACAAKAVGLI